jgi:hypothetical protein
VNDWFQITLECRIARHFFIGEFEKRHVRRRTRGSNTTSWSRKIKVNFPPLPYIHGVLNDVYHIVRYELVKDTRLHEARAITAQLSFLLHHAGGSSSAFH